jgi:hypothetical protein
LELVFSGADCLWSGLFQKSFSAEKDQIVLISWRKIFLSGFLLPIALFSAESYFQIFFLGLPVVQVQITEEFDPITKELLVDFHPRVNDWIPRRYFVDNQYRLRISPDLNGILKYEKNIHQYNMKQQYFQWLDGDIMRYSTGESRIIPQPAHHMLSLIIVLQYADYQPEKPALMELEGKLYNVWWEEVEDLDLPDQHAFEIFLKPLKGKSVLEETDFFTYKLDDPKARRFIGYSKEDGRIVNAKFIFGALTLTATPITKEESLFR